MWVAVAVATIAAVASVIAAVTAAVIAARAQARVQVHQAQSQRIAALEERLAHRKYDVYAPMLNLLNDIILGLVDDTKLSQTERESHQNLSTSFGTWLAVFGSDEAVASYHRWSQATFHQPVPQPILLRLWADLMLAARRDIGDKDTTTTVTDLLGLRLRDLYELPDNLTAMDLPLEDLCARFGWTPPWDSAATRARA